MKRPAFQFYPSDWRKDVELRSCSLAARGLWMDLLCVMHECEPYGHLVLNGRPMNAMQIVNQIGGSEGVVKKLLIELLDNGVARKTEAGVIYSKRMVADEDLRNRRAEGGKAGGEHGVKGAEHGSKGGRPAATKGGFETPLDDSQKPPPSSSSSSSASAKDKQPSVVPASAQSASPSPTTLKGDVNLQDIPKAALVPLDESFELPRKWGEDTEKLGWTPAEILHEAEKFRQYWVVGKGAGMRRGVRGWRQSWSTWINKAERFGIRRVA